MEKTYIFRAVLNGYVSIRAGESEIVIAGGQECMSQSPHILQMRDGIKLGDCNLIDHILFDGLTDAFHGIHMGITGIRVVIDTSLSYQNSFVITI